MEKENLISLLSETLKFYAEYRNYDNNQIKNDGGHMARFALDQAKNLENAMAKLEVDFDELQNKVTEKTPEEIQQELNDLLNGR